jgi:hypothetical protein
MPDGTGQDAVGLNCHLGRGHVGLARYFRREPAGDLTATEFYDDTTLRIYEPADKRLVPVWPRRC